MGYDGYIRVSRVGGREGDSFQSPEDQRDSIEGWAQSRGVKIDQWHEDYDVSGGTLTRPGLDAVVARIKAGKAEGVVVAKLSRFSRAGVASALGLFEEIYSAGGEVVAVDVGIDPTTPVGKFARTIMLALNEMELDRIKEGWTSAKGRAVERGVFVGPPSLGFEKRDLNPKTGKLCGPLYANEDAPLVARAFELSANEGLHAALEFCRGTWPERHWTVTKVRRLLANRLYKGEVVVGGCPTGNIEPLVDETTWLFAQHAQPRRKPKDDYPLSGIATCAACGKGLAGHTTGKPGNRHRAYRCTTQGCPLHVKAEPLEQLVDAALEATPAPGTRTGDDVLRTAQAVMAAQREIESYIDNTSIASVGEERWHRGLRTREERLAEAQREADAYTDVDPSPYARVATLTVQRSTAPLAERVTLQLAA
jgi:DNA invertase Pin-like site-specific DNA recombinase